MASIMDWRIRLAVEAMSREMPQPMSIGALARRVNLSRSRFTYLFRNELGCTPAAYFRDLRLDYARLLVERSFQPLKEIMVRVGFNDTSHFVRDFKRRHGATPGTLRPRTRSPDSCSPRRLARMSSTCRQPIVEAADTDRSPERSFDR